MSVSMRKRLDKLEKIAQPKPNENPKIKEFFEEFGKSYKYGMSLEEEEKIMRAIPFYDEELKEMIIKTIIELEKDI